MKIMVIAVAVAVLGAAPARAETATGAGYDSDVSDVYGAIQGVKATVLACSDSFPEVEDAAMRAYRGWRARHLAFLQEAQRAWKGLLRREARGDLDRIVEYEEYFERMQADYEDNLRKEMAADPARFRALCTAYPAQCLASPECDFEKTLATQVASMRRGPATPAAAK